MSNLNRRDFIKIITGIASALGLGAIVTPVVAYFYPPKLEEVPAEPVLVCPEAELAAGQGKTVRFGRYPALVINTPEGLKAYSAVCTHFACIVKWNLETNRIECPCHDGFFSPADGSVLSGPPPSPLAMLTAEVVDGQIFVKAGGAS
ncbi:MAG: Rieske (2Fe-2S) protein [Anaerolineales bacterium]|nr:Rieske (2Fe-2S) protein [Anaerolineales bacterium]